MSKLDSFGGRVGAQGEVADGFWFVLGVFCPFKDWLGCVILTDWIVLLSSFWFNVVDHGFVCDHDSVLCCMAYWVLQCDLFAGFRWRRALLAVSGCLYKILIACVEFWYKEKTILLPVQELLAELSD